MYKIYNDFWATEIIIFDNKIFESLFRNQEHMKNFAIKKIIINLEMNIFKNRL